jgi:mono/diheme cytochrome c family protein
MSSTQRLLLIACSMLVAILSTYTYLEQQNNTDTWYSQAQVQQGESLFLDHCASCHGAQAEGAENWTQVGADGNRPAPPLNGSGHAWHHSLADLTQTVIQGRGTMPAWEGTLTDAQIMATLAWTQSRWPSQIYNAWLQANP